MEITFLGLGNMGLPVALNLLKAGHRVKSVVHKRTEGPETLKAAGGERVFEPPYHSTPGEILRLHRRFPALRIVAAHLGGFHMWDESEEVLCGEDVYLDLSHTFGWMPQAQISRMIAKHGAERTLFGSDAPWQDAGRTLESLLDLGLGAGDLERICWRNAAQLLHIDV